MDKKVLIVVDMLNDFLHPRGALYCGDEARRIIEPVRRLIETFRRAAWPVMYIQDAHEVHDREFERFPPHAVKGSWGSEIIDELTPRQGEIVIQKTRFSAFFRTELEGLLQQLNPKEVWVVGVCTSICVMDTVADLRSRDYPVVVPLVGIADVDPFMHDCAVKRMEKVYGVVLREDPYP